MIRYLLVCVAVLVALPAAPVTAREMCWIGDSCTTGRAKTRSEKRFRARPAIAQRVIPGELGNQDGETPYISRGVYHRPGTKFAVFPNMTQRGSPDVVMTLSDTGIWSFVRVDRLPAPTSAAQIQDVRQAIAATRPVDTVAYVTPEKRYFQVRPSACVGKVTLKNEGTLKVGGGGALGPLSIEIGSELSLAMTLELDKGWLVVVDRFLSDATGEFLEIMSYQACGTSVNRGNDYVFDVFLNSEIRNLQGADLDYTGLPLNRGKPVIGCLEHYDVYAEYLREEHDIPEQWVPVVAAMTARWQRYQSHSTCEKPLHG